MSINCVMQCGTGELTPAAPGWQAVADQLAGRLHQLDSREVALLVYSCVKMRHNNTALLKEVVERVLGAPTGWMPLKLLADLTWAFASSRCGTVL